MNVAAKVFEFIDKWYPVIDIPEGMINSAFYNVDAGPRIACVVHSIMCRTLLWKGGLVFAIP